MPLVSEDPQAWAMGVRLSDLEAPFGAFLKKLSIEWHKTGTLVELEKKWGIKPSPFLQEMHDKYKGS
jgi:polar amino acid transport system substrate-binding protein